MRCLLKLPGNNIFGNRGAIVRINQLARLDRASWLNVKRGISFCASPLFMIYWRIPVTVNTIPFRSISLPVCIKPA